MSGLTTLPVEIPTWIFRDVAKLPKEPTPLPNQASFPFNVAYTCPFWLEILKSNPHFWESVVIDVAEDPTPFLDTLGLFQEGAINVTIFSSIKKDSRLGSDNDEDIQKHCENVRAQTIFSHLEPFIARCGTIIFDLVYQSSLPSAPKILTVDPPHLRTLSLKCQVYDVDDDEDDIEFEGPVSRPTLELYSLDDISLTGYAFMELYTTGLHGFFQGHYLNVFISHLMLYGEDYDHSSRSIRIFMAALEDIKCRKISLSDISLNSRTTPWKREHYDFGTESFDFDRCSRHFLYFFISAIVFDPSGGEPISLSFTKCSIPDFYDSLAAEDETFANVDFFDTPSQQDLDEDPQRAEDSLVNATKLFNPEIVHLKCCNGLTDDFFNQLSQNCEESEQRLAMLYINNCMCFIPGALINFIKAREHADNPLEFLCVSGGGPEISMEQAAWFSEQEYNYTWEAY